MKNITLILIIPILCMLGFTVSAQNIIAKPGTYQSVIDEAMILSAEERNALSRKLDAFQTVTGNELIVVAINSLMGTTVELYASKLFNEWGLGKKGQDNGILILIAVKDRRMRIETGYGVEDKLTDMECSRLLDEVLRPNFKAENYYEGIEIASNYIIKELAGDFKKEQYALRTVENIDKVDFALEKSSRRKDGLNPWITFIACFLSQIGLSVLLQSLYKKKKTLKESITLTTIMICALYPILAIVFTSIAGEEKWNYSTMNIGLLYMNAVALSIFLLTLLPVKVGHIAGKLFVDLLVFILCAMVSMVISLFTLIFTEQFEIYIGIALIMSIVIFVLYKMGKLKFLESSSGSGSSYSGTRSSYSDSSYSDSSSSYSDSSYGGGSSGGGGASGSW